MDEPKKLTVGDLVKGLALDKPIAAGGLMNAINHGLVEAIAAKGGLSIGDALTAAWRAKLLGVEATRQASVANEMSRTIAAVKLSNIAAIAGLDAALNAKALAINSTLAGLAKNLEAGLIASIKPVALLAAEGLTDSFTRLREEENAWFEALYQMGWWMPHSARSDFALEVGRLAYEGDRMAVRHAMNEASHSREFARTVKKGWMRHSVFAERRRFILDGLADHQRGRYRVSIPTLLPHLEGIAMAAFAPGTKKTKVPAVVSEAAGTYDELMGDSIVEAATKLYTRHDFDQVRASGRQLNRHLILHGRSTGYGTEENSTKLLFAFDLLASLVEQKARKG